MSIRFGVSPIAWANDDMPELGGDTPLADILRDIQELGFEGVELGGKFPRDAATLKALLAQYKLDLIGGWYSGSLLAQDGEAEIAALQPHLALLKALGSTVFVFAETSNAVHGDRGTALTGTPRLPALEWKTFGQRLTQVADYIQAQDLKFAYHHHLGTVVERAEDLQEFLRHTGPAVGLTLDTGHAALGGIDALEVIRHHPERVAHVHCKDVRWETFATARTGGASFLDGVLAGMFTVPGDGGLDYAEIMRALARINYSGWIVIEAEQDPGKADPRTYADLGLKTLRAEAARAGLQ
ncbi:myo-inosose-2 dehydratase [Pseudoxanthomonas indica]|uniref:2-keto-myo-inositol dehydratase n=1 Tax=Pseudoxanthomonas indica TaxID=428993 RepID=A0A1T5KAF9_9GAMM|nr:myo-inosose-2 dehydratase [Pseudoxanthomonas indica]GGD48039.1 myo-inosose-2 dehydratase [Pseudoxanthomonas indica]SKC60657.1 2-keto-myo-inositol dehydratase [Pseudoxanthomonas indica]